MSDRQIMRIASLVMLVHPYWSFTFLRMIASFPNVKCIYWFFRIDFVCLICFESAEIEAKLKNL